MDHYASGQHYHGQGRGDSGQSHGGTGRDVRGWALLRACLAELLATMLLVCLGVLGSRQFSFLGDGWVLLAVMCITQRVSDGHLNPAVSLGVWLAGEMSLVRLALYTMCQYTGGLVGAALALGLYTDISSLDNRYGTYSPNTKDGVNQGQAFGAELLGTFMLVCVYLSCTAERRGYRGIAPLCIAFTLIVGKAACMPMSGGALNPARSFGPAIVSLRDLLWNDPTPTSPYLPPAVTNDAYYHAMWKAQWLYILGPKLGAVLAAIAFRFLFSTEKRNKVYVK
eukprot:scpid63652/ scgid4566/ Aquaporin PIP2-7; Plasma membrane intrinsic protein 2-7; ZmPIP2-7; ZmPIP2